MTDYSEFDDVRFSPDPVTGPFVSSPKAVEAMRRLMHEHGLGFTYNPGGGQFTGPVEVQISTMNDVEDLHRLRQAIKTLSGEQEGESK